MIAGLSTLARKKKSAQRDPTRTAALRKQYVQACKKRFVALKKLLWETIVTNDALALDTTRSPLGILEAQPARRYDFPSDPAGKAQAFMNWLMDAVDEGILEVEERDGHRISAHSAWQNLYVRTAYTKGVAHADRVLGWEGISAPERELWQMFQQPFHANSLAMLYTRNFEELRGITEAMAQAISRELTMGMARGLGAKAIARALVRQVDKIGFYRAMLLARTEIIRAFAESTLNRFEEVGIEEVTGQVELATAGDLRVCPVCKGLNGRTYTLQEARGVIPVHPQCRCAWLPVIVKANWRLLINGRHNEILRVG